MHAPNTIGAPITIHPGRIGERDTWGVSGSAVKPFGSLAGIGPESRHGLDPVTSPLGHARISHSRSSVSRPGGQDTYSPSHSPGQGRNSRYLMCAPILLPLIGFPILGRARVRKQRIVVLDRGFGPGARQQLRTRGEGGCVADCEDGHATGRSGRTLHAEHEICLRPSDYAGHAQGCACDSEPSRGRPAAAAGLRIQLLARHQRGSDRDRHRPHAPEPVETPTP